MASRLADAHIVAQERLRALTGRAVGGVWAALPAYDEQNVDQFLTAVVPVVRAAQRQSVALTDSFLSRTLGRRPVGINPADVTQAAVRNGTPPGVVYRRPFVVVWTALKAGTLYEDAVAAGRARAEGAAATDVQLAMRATLQAFAEAHNGGR